MESFRLDGRRALVTGGSKGIGVGLARGLAEAGADIVLMARNEKELEQTRDVLQETGRSIGIASSDLSRPEEIPQVYADVEAQHGPVDILVNNAGIVIVKPFVEMTEVDWDLQIGVNLKAAFFATQEAAKAMIRDKLQGRIVNVASTSGFTASTIPSVPYDISKAGVRMLTMSSAVQLAKHGINVNAIAPGTIDTELSRGAVAVSYTQLTLPTSDLV